MEKAKVELDSGQGMSVVYGVPPVQREPLTSVIIAHGAGGPMYSPFIAYFHTALAREGFLSVKFNFPYMEARKKFPDKREVLENSYRKILDSIRSSKYSPRHMFIGGKSMGGRIASHIVAQGVDVDGLFFLGYPLHPPGNPGRLRDEHLYKISKPMLFVSGTRDSFASRDLLEKTLSRIGPNARVHWVEGGNHSLDTGRGKEALAETHEEVVRILVLWVNDCVERRC